MRMDIGYNREKNRKEVIEMEKRVMARVHLAKKKAQIIVEPVNPCTLG